MNIQTSTTAPSAASLLTPEKITWIVLPECNPVFNKIRNMLGDDGYRDNKEAFQETMCDYFNLGECTQQALQIYPMGGTTGGGKSLKVRWQLPGCGKSGGLRLAVVAYCTKRTVKIAGAWARKDEPSDSEFNGAVGTA